MYKSCLTVYDELAAVLAYPARWLEPFGRLWTFNGLEIGEVTLSDEEGEVDQELRYAVAQGEGGLQPG